MLMNDCVLALSFRVFVSGRARKRTKGVRRREWRVGLRQCVPSQGGRRPLLLCIASWIDLIAAARKSAHVGLGITHVICRNYAQEKICLSFGNFTLKRLLSAQ
jgi:hypothetical protein